MKTGTIVLIRFPYTDLTSSKRRPAVVLSQVSLHHSDVIVGFISSVLPTEVSNTDFVLDKSHDDFALTGLKSTSVFKMDKLATLDSSIFTGELGDVSPKTLANLKDCLRKALNLKKKTPQYFSLKRLTKPPFFIHRLHALFNPERRQRKHFKLFT